VHPHPLSYPCAIPVCIWPTMQSQPKGWRKLLMGVSIIHSVWFPIQLYISINLFYRLLLLLMAFRVHFCLLWVGLLLLGLVSHVLDTVLLINCHSCCLCCYYTLITDLVPYTHCVEYFCIERLVQSEVRTDGNQS